ncbi:MAG: DUF4838 domain-containing protein, partial [Lentisphaeria bacterium]|nr:DUF4838 domain-containing protein [Lentisphaeria bacterium]
QNGGTIIIWGDRSLLPSNVKRTAAMAKLLGAGEYSNFTGTPKFNSREWAECAKDPYVLKQMIASPAIALNKLTTAKGLVGNESGYVVTVNSLGKGKVYFVNICLTQSLTPYKQPYSPNANAALEQLFPFAKLLYKLIAECKPDMDKTKRERWDFIPLGPKCEDLKWDPPQIRKITSNRKFKELEGSPLNLVVEGQPRAILISSRAGELGAMGNLNRLLKKMSGTPALPITHRRAVGEKDGKWRYRGKLYDTLICFEEDLTPGVKINIKVSGNTIVITTPKGMAGMGMQTFMREYLDYWMLWPGKDGEHYVETKNVTVKPSELSDAPVIRERSLRNTLYTGAKEWKKSDGSKVKVAYSLGVINNAYRIGYDPTKAVKLQTGHREWWSAQRLGGGISSIGGVSFYNWGKRFGKSHPEYFALQYNGVRVSQGHVRICKSNPDVIKQAAKDAIDAIKKRPYAKFYALSPSDGGYESFCMCVECRKMDPCDAPRETHRIHLATGGTRPGRNRPVYPYVSATDRMLRFTSEVARLINKKIPDITVIFLAYASYEQPPKFYRNTPKKMLTTFVGLEYLNRKAMAKFRDSWNKWASISSDMRLRHNMLLGGQGMPLIYVKEMGKDLLHCAQTGMIAADFDSVPHNWANMGLNYFVLAHMLWDPTQKVEDLVDTYCKKAFGPAAEEMKEYYALCEELTSIFAGAEGSSIKELEDLTISAEMNFSQKFLAVYNPAILGKLEAILNRAKAKVTPGSQFAARLDFVGTGFEYCKLLTGFWRKYYAAPKKKALLPDVQELDNKLHELFEKHPFAVNIPSLVVGQYYSFWRNCGWKAGEPR